MNSIDIIRSLERMQKTVFSINDLSKIIKKSKDYSALISYRLKRSGSIREIEKNKYVLKDKNVYCVATNIVYPSYISFLTAFAYYDLTTQIPKQIQIITLKSKKKIEFDNYSIRFIKFKLNRFFGYKREKISSGFVFVSELEKAIVDALFLPRYCPIDETYNALNESIKDINVEKLIEYGLKMKSNVLLKRLGYLLEKNDIDIYNRLKNRLNNKYDLLDVLPSKGEKNKKWKLIINRRL